MPLSKKKLFFFGFTAIGVNILKLIMATYLCNAVLTAGFDKNIENWTFISKDVVIAFAWGIIITLTKITTSVADFPFANFLDNLNSKLGRRKTGVLMGFVPMMAGFILFLFPPFGDNLLLNTIWLAFFINLFYWFYSCVMLSYYASFAEITRDDNDRRFLSNVKSVADVVYYVMGFALIPVLVGFINIRVIALIFAPLALLIIAGIFMFKENPDAPNAGEERPKFFPSIAYACKNKAYMLWMIVFAIMTFGIQLFLTGQSVFLSGTAKFTGGQISIINACAFGPVPLTIALYNFVMKRKGFRFSFNYAMLAFVAGLGIITLLNVSTIPDGGLRFIMGIVGSLVCSFGIGTFFSVAYLIPSHVAAKEKEEKGYARPSMYFAVQGLVGASVTGLSTGFVWTSIIRDRGLTHLVMAITGVVLLLCCLSTLVLPKSIAHIGKVEKVKKYK